MKPKTWEQVRPSSAALAYANGYKAGKKDALECEEVKAMRDALANWVKYEEEQMAKDGPYVSLNIPRYINKAKQALASLEKLKETVR